MNATTPARQKLTYDEYLTLKNQGEIRYEFHDGTVVAMAGTTLCHNLLIDNVKDTLKRPFRAKKCNVFSESVKVEIYQTRFYVYPDLVLTCYPFDLQSQYMRQPVLLVEVLSKSTASDDRGTKWKACKKTPSLLYYMLVDQYAMNVEVFSRVENTDVWTYQTFENMDDVIVFPRLDFELSVGVIYDGIDLTVIDEEADATV